MTDRDQVQLLVKEINEAWVQGRPGELNQYFHKDMVIVGPDLQPLATGAEACARSYQDFLSHAAVHEYRESPPVVVVWATTAMAAYSWDIAYTSAGKSLRDSGHDLFVFNRDGTTWKAVFRAVLFTPSKP